MRVDILSEGSPEKHLDVLNVICQPVGGGIALDAMCCEGNSTRKLKYRRKVFVDVQYREIEMNPSDLFVVTDIFNFLSHDEYIYDAAFCLDGIEHLSKDEGYVLIDKLEKTADKVIFFTPLGDYAITDDNDPDHHHSGWLPSEFEALGYSTIVFPNFHADINTGAFFAFKFTRLFSLDADRCEQELERIVNELDQLSWTK